MSESGGTSGEHHLLEPKIHHCGGIRAETLSDLGLQVLLRVNARLKLPCWHVRGMGPPFEGCKLLRLHPLCPSWGIECSPCQPPYTTKLPQLSPVQVAQAGQNGQLELRMGVVDHHPINLDLLFGSAGQCAEKAWCEDPLALQEELFHFLVLRNHTVNIKGHGILWVCFRSEDIALKGRPGLGRPDGHGLRFQKELFGILHPSCLSCQVLTAGLLHRGLRMGDVCSRAVGITSFQAVSKVGDVELPEELGTTCFLVCDAKRP